MSKDFQQSFKRIGGVALASVLLASCSQEWGASDQYKFTDVDNNPYAKGKADMAGGRYGLAIESFRKALQSDPGSVKALNGLAAAYDLMGRFDLAERYYRLALNFDPSSIQSLNNLGYSYYLRGEYKKARTLFERAARVDAKNAIVVANMAALDKADMARQVADARAKSKAKTTEKSVATKWIERTDPQVQSMVTKPDPAMLAAAQKHKVEPRIVHTPQPLIEIATSEPGQVRTVAPAAVAVNTGRSPISVEPTTPAAVAQRTDAAPKTAIAMVTTKRQPQELDQASAAVPTVSVSKAATPAGTATTAPKMDTYALVAPSEPEAPVAKPAASLKDTADLPALNDSVAHDVRAKQSGPKTAALDAGPVALPAQSDAEVPAPLQGEAAAAADQPQKTAAVSASAQPALPDAPAPVPDTAQPVLAVVPAAKAAKQEPAVVPAVKAAKQEPAVVPAAPTEPAPTKAAAAMPKARAEEPMQMAALGATKEPTQTKAKPGKLAGKEAAQELASLARSVHIEISNGAGRLAMAARMKQYLKGHGAPKMRLTNAMSFTNKVSVLYFRPGQLASAQSLSSLLPVNPELRKRDDLVTDLRLVLGGDLLNFDRGLIDELK